MKNRIKKMDALLIVDAQKDFFPEGALPVPKGHEIIPIVNMWIQASRAKNRPIFASRDWHPANHCSFKPQGGLWPQHCIQNTPGAEIHPDIQLPPEAIIIDKADVPHVETHSAFEGKANTGETLDELLKKHGVRRLWVAGLALDYCVLTTSLASMEHGYETHLILEATRAITPKTEREAIECLQKTGVVIERNSSPYF